MRICVVGLFVLYPLFNAFGVVSPESAKLPSSLRKEPIDKNLEYYLRHDKTVRKYAQELFAAIDLHNAGRTKDALKAFLTLDKKEPNNAGTLLWVSLCQWKLGQAEKSDATLNHAAKSTDNPGILLLIGAEYLGRKDFYSAYKIGERVKALNPGAKDAFYLILPYHVNAERTTECENWMAEAKPYIRGDETLTLLFAIYMTKGKPIKEAEVQLTKEYLDALTLKTEDRWIKPYLKSKILFGEASLRGELNRTIPLDYAHEVQEALRLKPDLNGLRDDLVHAYYAHEMFAETVAVCYDFQRNEQFESDLNDFDTASFFFCAKSLIKAGQNKEFLAFIDRYNERARFTPGDLGQFLQDIAKNNNLETGYQLVSRPFFLKNLSNNKKIYDPLVTFSLLTKRLKEALDWSYKAEKDNYTSRVIFWGRFRALYDLGRINEALKVYEEHPEILSVLPPDPTSRVIDTYAKTKRWGTCVGVTTAYLERNIDQKTRSEAEAVLNECKKNKEDK